MKLIKIIRGVVVWIALLVMLLSLSVYAAGEGEPNDKKANATAISVNTEVTGKISKSSDYDWFKITIPQTGYIRVDLEHELLSSSSSYWRIYLYQSDGVTGVNDYDGYWTVTGNRNGTTSQIGLKAGTYYVKVQCNSYNHSDVTYGLKVNYTPSDEVEQEPNSTAKKATKIDLNKAYGGAIAHSSDEDWYQFTLSENGHITVDFDHEAISSNSNYWRIYVLQADGVTGVNDYDGYWTVTGNRNGTTSQIGLKAGTYYVKVQCNSYNHSDVTYGLKVNYTPSDEVEQEPNSTAKKATKMDLDKAYMGAVAHSSDEDWYQFTLSENGHITVDFDHEAISSNSNYWRIYILQADGVTGVNDYDGYWTVTGNQNGTTSQIGLQAGTYYVKVQCNSYNHSDVTYRLTVHYTQSDYAESEPNSMSSKATEVKPNTAYSGAIANVSDVDWYRFTLSAGAEVTVNFSHALLSSESNYWKIYLYREDGVTELAQQSVSGSANGAIQAGMLEAGTYYVKVQCNSYNHSDVTYQLNVSEKHDCSGSFTTKTDATCLKDGVREMVCKICSKVLKTEAIPATGHTLMDEEMLNAPSCTSKGRKQGSCSSCGETVTVEVEMLPHAYADWETEEEATCTETGKEARVCKDCSHIEERTVDAYNHAYGEWEIIAGSKLIPPIVKEKQCSACGAVEQYKDWSYIWVTILAAVAMIGVFIGVINYAKAFKKGN